MTDEAILPPDPDEDDGANEPVEGDVTETDQDQGEDVKTSEIPPDAI